MKASIVASVKSSIHLLGGVAADRGFVFLPRILVGEEISVGLAALGFRLASDVGGAQGREPALSGRHRGLHQRPLLLAHRGDQRILARAQRRPVIDDLVIDDLVIVGPHFLPLKGGG